MFGSVLLFFSYFSNKLYSETKIEKIGYTGETNFYQVDLSALSFGVYEFFASTGQYCLLGNYVDYWSIISSTNDEFKLIDKNTVQIYSGSWYSDVYRRKIL